MTNGEESRAEARIPHARGRRGIWLALAAVALVALLWLSLAGSLAVSRGRAYPQPVVALGIHIPLEHAHVNDLITFSATATTGQGLAYTWDFGDGQRATGRGVVTHAYNSSGTYTVTLMATDPIGQRTLTTKSVTIFPDPPGAAFFFTVDPSQPLSVTFVPTNNSSDNVTFSWDFGDGSSTQNSGAPIQHIYAQFGTYTVSLTETDSMLQSDTATQTIVLTLPQTQATFSVVPVAGNTRAFTFDGTASTGLGLSYSWAFGDGTTTQGAAAMIEHTYQSPGTYKVTLVVTDARGGSSASTIALVVS